jgi:hypothetical protein
VRTKINNHLDKLQEDLMKELTEVEQNVSDETRDLMVSLDEKQQTVHMGLHHTNSTTRTPMMLAV